MDPAPARRAFNAKRITRPAPVLMRYYLIVSLLATIGFPVALLVLWFRYQTLRYRFDDQGISVSWGVLFKKEVHLTYRRIQDIHLTRNILQRWMGLATLEIQTASGSAGAEMRIEGVLEADQLRDYLYAKMRGAREEADDASDRPASGETSDPSQQALILLQGIRDELGALRRTADRQD